MSSGGRPFDPRPSEELLSLVIHARSRRKSMLADVSSFSSRWVLSTGEKAPLTLCLFCLRLLQLVQSNFVLFCTYAADLRDHFQNIVLTILVSGAFSSKVPERFTASHLFVNQHYLKHLHPSHSPLLSASMHHTSYPSTFTCCSLHSALTITLRGSEEGSITC